jgi:DNA-binding transcriptional LysR family regulator
VLAASTVAEVADFSLTQLRYFVTSAEMGNMSDAARSLHASQSAVSMAIQRLERQLGTQLFCRHRTKGVSLTPSGRVLLADARALLHQAQVIQDRCREWQGTINGRLSVAFLRSIAPFVYPALLTKIKARHPQLTVTAHECGVEDVLDLLRAGTCELAVTSGLPGHPLSFTQLATVPLVAIVASDDPLAGIGQATMKELATRPLLMVDGPRGHPGSPASYSALLAQGEPDVIETSSVSTMLGLVRAGVGVALMPRRGTNTTWLGDRITSVEILSDHIPSSDIGIATLPGLPPSRRVQEVSTVLYETVREIYCVTDVTEVAEYTVA